VTSRKIDDWRYRKEEDKIISSLFTASLAYGNPTAKDDLEKVEWFDVSELQEMIEEEKIVAEHHDLIKSLLEHLKKIKTQKDDLINHKN
jgi:bifunctional NMN adenylyltransferase/nudix hydrolase